ncbi:DUF4287 domain-containing protein [Microbacterium sp. PMB16]|uniref:DUF4287 domain-containing protein n=1 Tax=Microbacterium sp. PMB16 TaxID=3120157 RepID=UPI003F4C28DC
MDVDAATQTMIDNLPAKTGRELPAWFATLDAAAIDGHGAAVAFLKSEHGVTHGFANLIVKLHRSQGETVTAEGLVDAQYEGRKAGLRPVYESLVAAASALGDDVEVSPKKTGVSLRRHKQFALVEAPSAARISVGINLRDVAPTERLRSASGMCTHRVDVTSVEEVDAELLGWLRDAYDRA